MWVILEGTEAVIVVVGSSGPSGPPGPGPGAYSVVVASTQPLQGTWEVNVSVVV